MAYVFLLCRLHVQYFKQYRLRRSLYLIFGGSMSEKNSHEIYFRNTVVVLFITILSKNGFQLTIKSMNEMFRCTSIGYVTK